jgi:hypothetical protein
MKMLLRIGLVAVPVVIGVSSCRAPTEPIGPIVQTNTITISNNTASNRNVEVALGSRILFINNDTRSHNMTSDPHPEHDDCPDLNQVGFLLPGEKRETGNLVEARTCGFHDHDNPSISGLHGFITIK